MRPSRLRARRRRMVRFRRGVYLLPSLLTTANIFCGFTSIVRAFQGEYQTAAMLIFAAAVLDGLDGRIARMTGATSEFGGEFDSLADVVSFGLAPAFLADVWGLAPLGRYGWVFGFLFLICGAVRLARFNIQHGASDRRWFVGLPIPMAAGVVAGCVLEFEDRIDQPVRAGIFAALVLLTSFLMVSRFRYRSFKDIDPRARSPFRAVLLIAALLAAIALHPPLALVLVAGIYAASGPLGYLTGLLGHGRRAPVPPREGDPEEEPAAREEAPTGAR